MYILRWIIHYEVAAFIICSIVYFVFIYYKNFPTWQNKIYRILLTVSLLTIIWNFTAIYTVVKWVDRYKILNYVFNIIYLLLFNSIPVLYYLFILAITKRKAEVTKFEKLAFFVPYTISFVCIVTTPITKFIFSIKEKSGYQQEKGMIVLYIISLIYLLLSLIKTICYRHKLNKLQRSAAFFYTVSSITVVIIQLIIPKYLLIEFAISMSMFFIYLTLQNPLEFKDSVTGAFNHEAFIKTVNEFVDTYNQFSILGIQIEGLKFINEKFGVENTNILLRQITEYLISLKKQNRVFHLSDFQFAVFIENEEEQKEMIRKIKERFDNPFYLNEVEISLWVSLCYLNYPENVKTLNDVIDTIDYTMKEAKKQKQNLVIYGSEEILKQKQREDAVEQAIAFAVKNESFEVYYQPIYSVQKKKYTSAEALVRLKDEELGFISPDEFIPLAERNGQILKIGEIVFQKVCQMIQKEQIWKTQLECIHVNLSVVQCMQEDLAENLFSIMKQYKIPHSMINFEITETSAVNSGEKLMTTMKQFEEKGIHFSLDDYGTGYSNIANIMQHNYKIVKLDKSIVWAAQSNHQAFVSLKHMIAMIKELNMRILAEGIETKEQEELLEKMQCEYFQGYFFSKPLPEKEFLKFIDNSAF